jgi:hypothetical protein
MPTPPPAIRPNLLYPAILSPSIWLAVIPADSSALKDCEKSKVGNKRQTSTRSFLKSIFLTLIITYGQFKTFTENFSRDQKIDLWESSE